MASDEGVGTGQGRVPQYVLDDIRDNWDLVGRWVEDAEFRRELLNDPQGVARTNDWNLSDETVSWIQERTQARGLASLVGDDPGGVIAF